MHGHDTIICNASFEVCILQCIASICASHPRRIGCILLNDIFHCVEVAFALGHLLVVDHQHAVAEHALRPQVWLFLPYTGMVVQSHRQVVLHEVLARHSEVHWIPKPKFALHLLQYVLLYLGSLRKRCIQEDIVEDVVSQILRFDAIWARFLARKIATLQYVRNGIVCHIDRAVRQGFDDELLIPWNSGTQSERPAASPLFQPTNSIAEGILETLVVVTPSR
mmetsp:Transcript_48565/g.77342  ORF Transcript_48565/g.77342 Transcript_48565/m.77342 type:complete len:222 (+) Transcript_48565:1274-1939(+)